MDSSTRSKWQVRLAVLVLFVVGFMAGALTMNIYRARQRPPRAGGRGGFEQMLDRLNLTQDQRTQVGKIFDDARNQLDELRRGSEPKFREVRKNTDERLQSVLTPEQWEKYSKPFAGRTNAPTRLMTNSAPVRPAPAAPATGQTLPATPAAPAPASPRVPTN